MSERKVVIVYGTGADLYDGVHIAASGKGCFSTVCGVPSDLDLTRAISDNDHRVTCMECLKIWERSRFFRLSDFDDEAIDFYRSMD